MIPFIERLPKIGLLVLVCAVIALIAGVSLYNERARDELMGEAAEREDLKRALLTIKDSDLVYGARNADVKFIMYSDADCRYCRSLYPKLKNIVDTSEEGSVALVYRHIPLYSHRDTIDATEIAGMCVAREQGDEGFFRFIDALFARLPAGVETDDVELSTLLASGSVAGVDDTVLQDCIESGYGADVLLSQHSSGGALMVVTIPHTFVVSDTEVYSMPLDLPEAAFRNAVNSLAQPDEQQS